VAGYRCFAFSISWLLILGRRDVMGEPLTKRREMIEHPP
jgi:hypothetical protein